MLGGKVSWCHLCTGNRHSVPEAWRRLPRRRRCLSGSCYLLLSVVLFSLAWPALSAAQGAASGAEPEAAIDTAPVVIDGRTLFRVRGVSAFPAEQRASQIRARIRDIASDRTIDPVTLRIETTETLSVLYAGDRWVMRVIEADAELEGLERGTLAELTGNRIVTAIEEYRELRSPRRLLFGVGYTVVATVILAALLWGLAWSVRRVRTLLDRLLDARIRVLEAKSSRIVQARQVAMTLHGLLRGGHILGVLIVLYVYLNTVLGLFPWTRGIAARLFDFVLDPLRVLGGGFVAYLPNLFFLVVLFFITRYLLKIMRMAFEALERGTLRWQGFEPEWAVPTYRLARLLVLAFAVVVAYPHIPGSDSTAFKGVTIFLGVLFSLGSTGVVANIIAGYTMTYRRAFKLGDRIRIGQTMGEVSEIRLLVTRLRTAKNEDVVIPNSTILSSEVVNYSTLARKEGLILHTVVGIGYEVPWRQVEAMLLLAAGRTEGLMRDPMPFVLQTSLGDFAVTYELNAYCDDAGKMPRLYSSLHRNIQDVFNEYGVQIMTPNYEADPEKPKLVPPDQWYAAPAATDASAASPAAARPE
jgi:small-conductance mechanosensitive channel